VRRYAPNDLVRMSTPQGGVDGRAALAAGMVGRQAGHKSRAEAGAVLALVSGAVVWGWGRKCVSASLLRAFEVS
jgi:hypothetical protein